MTVQTKVCRLCKKPIEAGEPVEVKEVNYGRKIFVHSACWAQHTESVHLDQCLRYAVDQTNYVLAQLPRWKPPEIDSPAFAAIVESALFREFAAKYQPEHGSVLLLGESGSGKTSAVIALIRRLLNEALQSGAEWREGHITGTYYIPSGPRPSPKLSRASGFVWARAADIVRARRTHALGDGDPPLITRCYGATLLVVDEWGPEPEDRDGDLYALINERYERGVPTIAASGKTSKEFRAKYGDALFRRLTDPGTQGKAVGTLAEDFA